MFTFTRRSNDIALKPHREVKNKLLSLKEICIFSFHIIGTFSFTESIYLDVVSDISSGIEDTNKVLLEKSTREIAASIRRRSPNFYESNSNSALERPIFATPISDRTITENSSSCKFTCSVLSTECDISWEKNGIPIRPSSKYRQTFTDGLAILEIYDVTDDDAAKYSCVASNKYGECITSAKLKVYSGFKPTVSMPPTVTRQMKGRVHRVALHQPTLHCIFSQAPVLLFNSLFVYLHMTIILFSFLYSAFFHFCF
jgi:hypothetical protein